MNYPDVTKNVKFDFDNYSKKEQEIFSIFATYDNVVYNKTYLLLFITVALDR